MLPIVVEIISHFKELPSIALVNGNIGTLLSRFVLILYLSVGTLSMVAFCIGFPKFSFCVNARFKTFINCSYQFGFVGSFHSMV